MAGPDPLQLAVRENATWVDVVCRVHKLAPEADRSLWWSAHRTPPLYPDAVTLDPDVDEVDVLARIHDGPGASVKDSFATLDLADAGYRVLFDATWLGRPPGPAADGGDAGFRVVREKLLFARWCRAWGGPDDVLLPPVRRAPGVSVLGRETASGYDAGAVLHRTDVGGTAVVGVSNTFGPLADVAAAAIARHPDAWVVGYERDRAVDEMMTAGFEPLGPLRVWTR